jgi:hypothetical protein
MNIKADTINQIFAHLFVVKILHKGYETPDENFLQKGLFIRPDTATQQLFHEYKMSYRFYNNTLVCFIQSSLANPPAADPKTPLISIIENIHIRFLVQTSSEFTGKTWVVSAGSKQVYQFSNQINNTDGTNFYLNAPVENFSAAKEYGAGTVVQDGGLLYSALQPIPASSGIAIGNGNFWKAGVATEQAVNNADLKDLAAVKPDGDCFAVIDLYNNGTTNNSYKLFDGSGNLFDPAPSFVIRFESKP